MQSVRLWAHARVQAIDLKTEPIGAGRLWPLRRQVQPHRRGAPAPIPTISANPTSPESATTALTALAELRDSGHLTEAEFSDAKSAILGGLTHPSEETGLLADGAIAAPLKQSRWSYYSRGGGSR